VEDDRITTIRIIGAGLREGWRVQRDTPGYGPDLDAAQLRQAAAEARRYRDMR
jgi:8-hydroxy-5-deazaflavin:NADPH oxidoreductase